MVNEEKVRSDEVSIYNGPSKWDLVIKGLADSETVFFEVWKVADEMVKIELSVEGLINRGNADHWLVLGRVRSDFKCLGKLLDDPRYFQGGEKVSTEKPVDDPVYFWAHYRLRDRKGRMRISIINANEDSPWDPKYFPF